uniref:Uncharacterized protein n=1 Tax=Oryza punctata TaxID=4537 RepID=A0A0E0LCZ0_ORYPU
MKLDKGRTPGPQLVGGRSTANHVAGNSAWFPHARSCTNRKVDPTDVVTSDATSSREAIKRAKSCKLSLMQVQRQQIKHDGFPGSHCCAARHPDPPSDVRRHRWRPPRQASGC